jgi:hypothetical protein
MWNNFINESSIKGYSGDYLLYIRECMSLRVVVKANRFEFVHLIILCERNTITIN